MRLHTVPPAGIGLPTPHMHDLCVDHRLAPTLGSIVRPCPHTCCPSATAPGEGETPHGKFDNSQPQGMAVLQRVLGLLRVSLGSGSTRHVASLEGAVGRAMQRHSLTVLGRTHWVAFQPMGVPGLAVARPSPEVGSCQTCHAASLPRQVQWQMDNRYVDRAERSIPASVQVCGQRTGRACEGSVGRSLLVVLCGGAPRPLGVTGLAMRRLSLKMRSGISFLGIVGVGLHTWRNSVRFLL